MSRLAAGGRIDRSRPLRFTFDGDAYEGYAGDTLASALLANDVRVVARSTVLDRPRGIFAAGSEDPNAYVQLHAPWSEPLALATEVELVEGLDASSLAGRGRLTEEPDLGRYEKRFHHCDVLVVGAGPAGLAAALAAGRAGARVLLAEMQPELGGSLLWSDETVDGEAAVGWVAGVEGELAAMPEVVLLRRTVATGSYDDNCLYLVEHVAPEGPRHERLWQVRAKRVVLATGATERPIVFANNDRPGIMLASAVRTYVHRFAVVPGRRAAVFTANDSGYAAAIDLQRAGVEVTAVVDSRAGPPPVAGSLRRVDVFAGYAVADAQGDGGLEGVILAPLLRESMSLGPAHRLACDLLAVSGGFDPTLGLHHHRRGPTRFDAALGCIVPAAMVRDQRVIGAAAGHFSLDACLHDGFEAGAKGAFAAGFGDGKAPKLPATETRIETPPKTLWLVPPLPGAGLENHFVDLHRDAPASEIARALGAGVRSIEHVKRFTLIGTGADQGRLASVNASAVAAALLGVGPDEIGTSTSRAPVRPVQFATLAGGARGDLFDPVRTTPIHAWHVARGAVFEDVGQWKRPWYFPSPGESMEDAVLRECRTVREGVGAVDASTLGKIDIQGPDAAEFLNRIYTNAFDNLAPGTCRYGLMCKPDGMVFDDGVVMRLAEDHFLATTTTGGAATVLDHMEEYLQTEWPDLRVRLTSVTDHWATIAVAGPRSREVIAVLAPDLAVDPGGFPFMAIREATVAGIEARVVRVSFSGELAYEINVPGWYGLAMWEAVMAAGEPFGIAPYGTETMHVLRAEKGFIVVGHETDGTVTPHDLGMGWVVSKKKPFFLGRRSHSRADTTRPDRKQLVGLLPEDSDLRLPEGAQLVLDPEQPIPMTMAGHVTSSYRSAALGRTFALALLRSGRERMGQTVYAPLIEGTFAATVVEPVFYDPEGNRRDG